jgi:hypothetical protein
MKYLFIIFIVMAAQICRHSIKNANSILTYHELKLRLVDSLGEVDYCDRDDYPVIRPGLEQASAQKFFDTINPNSEELQALTQHAGLAGKTNFTNDEKLMLYRQHKALLAVMLDTLPVKYSFKINVKTPAVKEWHYEGQISPSGKILVQVKNPFKLNCPICLPYNALIETPKGKIEVRYLKTGDPVFTADAEGHRFVTTIFNTGKTPVPAGHKMIHIKLNDGREFTASFGHPLADGRVLSQLKRYDPVQNSSVSEVDTISYNGGFTYDILPGGNTGFYIVNGILVGSTLKNTVLAVSQKNF